MSQLANANKPRTYLVPTTNGAEYAVASNKTNQCKKLLLSLLRGDARESLMNNIGLSDRKALGSLLFKMQSNGWLTGDSKPIRLSKTPLAQSLLLLLESLSSQGKGILADHLGCCIASVGYNKAEVNKIAAFSASLYPLGNRYHLETDDETPGLEISIKRGTSNLFIRHLHIGTRVFHLALAGEVQHVDNNFVNLVTRLARRCPERNLHA